MTELQAKEKICPFLHLATQHRKDGEIYFSYTYCQGSKCMAWVSGNTVSWVESKIVGKIIKKSWFNDMPTGYCSKVTQ